MSGLNKFARLASWCAAAAATVVLAAACGTVRQSPSNVALTAADAIAVASIANYTETPDAGRAAESIAANVLRASGHTDVRVAPTDANANSMFDTARANPEKKLEWARSQQIKYVLTGAVEEWRYKVGVDGEPVVGVTFELIEVETGKVVWSSTGTRTGFSRSGLTSIAQSLIGRVLSPLGARS